MVYILEQAAGSQERHIWCSHTSTPHFEFDTHFDKIPKNQCFHPFSHHQKSPLSHQKQPQTLINQCFNRTQPKTTLIIRKFHLTNYQKFNHKISQTPVKSTLLLSNTNQNFTLLSKSKNLSRHETHNEHNQKITIISIIKRE